MTREEAIQWLSDHGKRPAIHANGKWCWYLSNRPFPQSILPIIGSKSIFIFETETEAMQWAIEKVTKDLKAPTDPRELFKSLWFAQEPDPYPTYEEVFVMGFEAARKEFSS